MTFQELIESAKPLYNIDHDDILYNRTVVDLYNINQERYDICIAGISEYNDIAMIHWVYTTNDAMYPDPDFQRSDDMVQYYTCEVIYELLTQKYREQLQIEDISSICMI